MVNQVLPSLVLSRSIEALTLFGVVPLFVWANPFDWALGRMMLGVLWIGSFFALGILIRQKVPLATFLHAPTGRAIFLPMLMRVGAATIAMTALMVVVAPEALFSLPRQSLSLWVFVMFFYPLLSALPQAFLFRSYFFARYEGLVRSPFIFAFLNILAFTLAHSFLGNGEALLLSAGAGVILTWAYVQHRSLLWSWVEHSLLGNIAFTLGMGQFLYHGAVFAR